MQNEAQVQKIFVGGFDDVQEQELRALFARFGEIVDCHVHYRGTFGFVSFRRREDAENAILNMDEECYDFNQLTVEWANGWPKNYTSEERSTDGYQEVYNRTIPNNTTVHCKGLRRNTTVEMLEEVFSPFGAVEDIRLLTGHSDYAFIRFNSKHAATRAICSIDDTSINGSIVKCNWSLRSNCHVHDIIHGLLLSDSESTESSSESSSPSLPSTTEAEDNFERVFNETTLNNCTVYCGNLTPSITNERVREIFSPYGIIEDINLFVEQSDYGFVRFNTKEAATLAICAVNLQTPSQNNGCPIRCNWAYRPNNSRREGSESSTASSSSADPTLPASSTRADLNLSASSTSADPPFSHFSGLCIFSEDTPTSPEDASEGAAKSNEKRDLLCKICMVEELGIVFLECGHMTSCVKCAQQIFICPVCRKTITRKVRTYLS